MEVIEMQESLENVKFEVIWEGKPAGLWQRFLSMIHLNFTTYQITKDELITTTGFFRKKTNTVELYMLKDPDSTETLYQRILGIGTISVVVDTHGTSERQGEKVWIRNIQDPAKVRKLLRDAIEADVMERKITYFDKI